MNAGERDRKCGYREIRAISGYADARRQTHVCISVCVCVCVRRVHTRQRRERQGEPGCAMNYDRWAGELAAPLKSRLIYYYVLLLLFGYLYPYNIMPREIPGSRRYVTRSLAVFPPGSGPHFPRIGHNLESSPRASTSSNIVRERLSNGCLPLSRLSFRFAFPILRFQSFDKDCDEI